MIVQHVSRDRIAHVWHIVRPMVDAGLAVNGDFTAEDARLMCVAGDWSLWTAAVPGRTVAVALVEVAVSGNRRVMTVVAGAGEGRAGVEALWPELQRYARRYDCQVVRWHGRPGWRRSGFLPKGARHVADVMEIEV